MANDDYVILGDREVPASWTIGDQTVRVTELTAGKLSPDGTTLTGAAGRATLTVPGAKALRVREGIDLPDNVLTLRQVAQVVDKVTDARTQVGLAEALAIDPAARLGHAVTIDTALDRSELTSLLGKGLDLPGLLTKAATVTLEFTELTVDLARRLVRRGFIDWPGSLTWWRPLVIEIDGFTLTIARFRLSPKGSSASATLQLPAGVTDAGSCRPATIDLGSIAISPTGDYFFDLPTQAYGPWLVGDTGLVAQGTGVVVDLSTTQSAPGFPLVWRGLVLGAGAASGETTVPEPCNTGYLRGRYAFGQAVVQAAGLSATLELTSPVGFTALNPYGQAFDLQTGHLEVQGSVIVGGQFEQITTLLPENAVWEAPHTPVKHPFDVVTLQPDLDLMGTQAGTPIPLEWGELTRAGDEVIPWRSTSHLAYLFLPAGAFASYSPVATGTFVSPLITQNAPQSLAQLDAHHAAGVTFAAFLDTTLASPDGPDGVVRPYRLPEVQGWLRAGITGLDGQLFAFSSQHDGAGDPRRTGYVGRQPFDAILQFGRYKTPFVELVTSAVHESTLDAYLYLEAPVDLQRLSALDIGITSTAHLVGGDIDLPAGGVRLGYWDVQLVPTGPPTQAAVLSVRTGRILLTAAGIHEPVHFARPFGLTWGEILATGDLGALFLDFNDWGQRFDGFAFHPDALTLSPYAAGTLDPFVAVSGHVLVCYFGLLYVNVRDAARLGTGSSPFPRDVTVPKTPLTPHSQATDLTLAGDWWDVNTARLADFLCVDADVDYNVAAQDGFLGTGTAEFSFLHSLRIDITVELRATATDIRISSLAAHGLDLGPVSSVGSLSHIVGSARSEGTGLARITVFGLIEQSVDALFTNKVGYDVEANFTVTPTSVDLYVSGDMLLAATVAEVEASATAHLFFDFLTGTAEGELFGRVDADALVAGLSGEGQLSWHISPAMQYLQGRLKVSMFTTIVSGGLEGGFFIGHDVPNALAWALDTSDPHFGMSRAIMPPLITGVYGYGLASFGFDAFVFGGGVDIFVGAGAFSTPVPGFPTPPLVPAPELPYLVTALGVYVHGEILGGLVSAAGWANLSLVAGIPPYFEGTLGLRGCVLWVLCASVTVTAGVNSGGFYLY